MNSIVAIAVFAGSGGIGLLVASAAAVLSDASNRLTVNRLLGRNACPSCGYPLAGLPDDAPCPECGLPLTRGVFTLIPQRHPLARLVMSVPLLVIGVLVAAGTLVLVSSFAGGPVSPGTTAVLPLIALFPTLFFTLGVARDLAAIGLETRHAPGFLRIQHTTEWAMAVPAGLGVLLAVVHAIVTRDDPDMGLTFLIACMGFLAAHILGSINALTQWLRLRATLRIESPTRANEIER